MVELNHCGKGYNLESFASRAKKQPGSLLMYLWHGLYHQNQGVREKMRIPNNSWKRIFTTCSELLRGKHKKILHDSESFWNWSPVYEKPPRASTAALSAISVSVLNAFPAMVARMYMFYSRIFEKLAQTSLLHLLCACLKNQWKRHPSQRGGQAEGSGTGVIFACELWSAFAGILESWTAPWKHLEQGRIIRLKYTYSKVFCTCHSLSLSLLLSLSCKSLD